MSVSRIDVDQLRIVMHGVTPAAAQAIAAGLEAGLIARLGALRTVPAPSRIETADLGAIDVPPAMDHRAVIDAIASRFLDGLEGLSRGIQARAGGAP